MKTLLTLPRVVAVAAALLIQGEAALADSAAAAPQTQAPAGQRAWAEPSFDWIKHTQAMLDELKVKLNLTSGQSGAWATWSKGVMDDAQRHLDRIKAMHDMQPPAPAPDLTTPERMARHAERMRVAVNRMQEQLKQLDAAQVRTKAFYDQLDTNQKTIFDLYWKEVYHSGGMGHGMMNGHWGGGYGRGPMGGGYGAPQNGALKP